MDISGYEYQHASHGCAHAYLLREVLAILNQCCTDETARRVFDLGCGNGSVAASLDEQGFKVVGVDPSDTGIAQARQAYPKLQLEIGSSEENLAARFGTYPIVLSLEVVEHVFAPRRFAATLYALLEPGGTAVISTPYHGYFKNLILAITGKFDNHFTALWDNGHIKFWSMRTLEMLLRESGFEDIQFRRIGRVPVLAKSMIAIARKPER